jgi:uncharacterized membrane protein (UPF0127 family)
MQERQGGVVIATTRAGYLVSVSRSIRSVLFCLVAAVCALLGCSPAAEHPTVQVEFVAPEGKGIRSFEVEVVSTPLTRAKGLMYRREVGEGKGMLFVFPDEKVQSFWMKNTLVPLDMVFVSKEMKVVGILENVPPLTEDPRFVDIPSLYVLEFAGGTMRKVGVRTGAKLVIRGQIARGL